MYGSTCADMQVDVMGECLSSIKHVVGLEEGRSVTSVAAEFGIAHSIVSRLWRQFQTTGTAIRGFSSGRPRSPDLNPIEHVWDFLGRRLAAGTLPPVTIRELRLALQDEWAAMPQQLIDTIILSMGRRCETYLAVRGDHIPY
ncbi:transposable element Tcb1 transposase [Trichonephila clavipes]|nr:transposable element Tcb1 transposase [Trichonephila clavipes]